MVTIIILYKRELMSDVIWQPTASNDQCHAKDIIIAIAIIIIVIVTQAIFIPSQQSCEQLTLNKTNSLMNAKHLAFSIFHVFHVFNIITNILISCVIVVSMINVIIMKLVKAHKLRITARAVPTLLMLSPFPFWEYQTTAHEPGCELIQESSRQFWQFDVKAKP